VSLTRELIARLRVRLGEASPMPPRGRAVPVAPPPRKIFPSGRGGQGGEKKKDPLAQESIEHTTALIGIGHVGTRYATDVVLQFQAELAVAHAAVAAVLEPGWAESKGLLPLRSRVEDHRQFLLRPDLGRRLAPESRQLLMDRANKGVDVQPILADGLSAQACMGSGTALLTAVTRECESLGLSVGTPMCAQFARVWLEDEIGEVVGAKVAMILLGERPGLGTGDGLSAYLVYEPTVGKADSDRNMMSNIHERGTPPAEAARRLALLAGAMIEQRRSGVTLDLNALSAELGEAASGGYREPQPRVRLVDVAQKAAQKEVGS
jgi:ethanolamine ammonia-lyase small subunit